MPKLTNTTSFASTRFWNRKRVQLGGALLFAVGAPMSFLALFYPNFSGTLSGQLTVGGVAAAAIMSVFFLRTIALYPGIRTSVFVLPVVLSVYGMIFALFLFFRLDYSRVAMLSAAIAMLIWLYLVHLMIERSPALHIGVVPVGSVDILREVSGLKLAWLNEPRLSIHYDLLVADFRADLPDEWEAFLADCALAGVPILHVKQLVESLTGKVKIEHLSENSFGSLIPFMGYLRVRRIADFITAVAVGVIMTPVFLIVALLIKLDSPGPVFFRQIRIGYRGEPLKMFKFRTMFSGREEDPRYGAMTQPNDARITRVGRFLRRTRLDELGQVINILKGEMSWIGPRPEAEPLARWYEAELPFYRYRHIVPPGITGWAQVNQGHVTELDDVMNKLHYDFYYIKNFSPWLDGLIIAKTVQTVFSGTGAK